MNRLLLAAALLLASVGCSRSGTRQELPLAFSPITEGLREPHRATAPLLETVSCLPPREWPGAPVCQSSRIYPDGSYYLLVTADPANPRWSLLSTLRPEGIAQLDELFASACEGADPLYGNDAGSTRHLVNMPACHREIVITGVPAGKLAGLAQVPLIIGRNLAPIPPGR